MIYLLTVSDKHSDPEYIAFEDRDYATEVAAESMIDLAKHYGLSEMNMDITPCDGTDGWYLAIQSNCGSFSINVRAIETRTG